MREPVTVDEALLAGWPLPQPGADADKEERGRVLVIAGSREMPGAAILAATAALRAGAGKLAVATAQSVAAMVAAALPEARVFGWPEDADGGPAEGAHEALADIAMRASAILVGPGMIGSEGTLRFVEQFLPFASKATLVLDALAMDVVRAGGAAHRCAILTPHAGEMAHLTGLPKDEIAADPARVACRFAHEWKAVVALKGARTWVASPRDACWLHEASCPGLGTSGSGDVLAGVIAGLAARGAPPEQAAVWGVRLHARAGEALEREVGSVGFLARELPARIPAAMRAGS